MKKYKIDLPFIDAPPSVEKQQRVSWIINGESTTGSNSSYRPEGVLNRVSWQLYQNIVFLKNEFEERNETYDVATERLIQYDEDNKYMMNTVNSIDTNVTSLNNRMDIMSDVVENNNEEVQSFSSRLGVVELQSATNAEDIEHHSTNMDIELESINNRIDSIVAGEVDSYSKLESDEKFETIQNVSNSIKVVENKIPVVVDSYGESTEMAVSQKLMTDNMNIISLQSSQLARYYQKINTGLPIKINCIGTSITEGWDNYSPDKIPAPNNKSAFVAPITYPQRLETILRDIYNREDIEVVNHGFSGTTVKRAYDRLKNKDLEADLSIMEFGANDSTQTELNDFIINLDIFLRHEIMSGRGVILLVPSKTKEGENVSRRAITTAMKILSEKYGIPLIDTAQFLSNCDESFYSDGVHLNKKGYSYFATKVSSFCSGMGVSISPIVSYGDSLLTRPILDSIVYSKNSEKSTIPKVAVFGTLTPRETNIDRGIAGKMNGLNGDSYIYYSFYTENDNTLVHPSIRFYGPAKVTMTLNDNQGYPDLNNTLDRKLKYYHDFGSEVIYDHIDDGVVFTDVYNSKMNPILIPKSGWNILKLKVEGGDIFLLSMDFYNHKDLEGGIIKVMGDNKTEIMETRIHLDILTRNLPFVYYSIDYYKNPLIYFKWGGFNTYSIIKIELGGRTTSTWKIMGEVENYGEGRRISGIKLDEQTRELVILWDTTASLTERGAYTITL